MPRRSESQRSEYFQELIARAKDIDQRLRDAQQETEFTLTNEMVEMIRDEYLDWYGECLEVLPGDLTDAFRREYEGSWVTSKIKKFLADPGMSNPLTASVDRSKTGAELFSHWRYPYLSTFRDPIIQQQSILRQAAGRSATPKTGEEARSVFVIYGRDKGSRDVVFAVLRAAGLRPLEFEQARRLTGETSPYIGSILEAAFNNAQAIVVLFTEDEKVRLRDDLLGPRDSKRFEHQPRPNVIFEAGMALGLMPKRTIIVVMGNVREMSDLHGRHVVSWNGGSVAARKRLLQRLEDAGCPVDIDGEDWMEVGNTSS